MKSKLLIPFFALAIIYIWTPNKSKASGAAAGELVYEWLSDSTYRFLFKMYQDCAAGSEPDSVPLCLVNTCNNTTTTYHMQKWTSVNGITVGASCPTIKTTCDSIGSIVTGYKEFWYYKIVTLPAQCNQWKMYSFAPGRNSGINNIANPTTSPLYAEVTFNNTISHTNSSPYYAVKPLVFVAQNQAYLWNNAAIDPDLDSLATSVINPLTGSTNCSGSASNVTYNSASPPISVPGNPFQTNNQFALNAITGNNTFTSTALGKNNYTIKTSEYRNGTLIGSVTREVQVQSFPTPPNPGGSTTFGCGVSYTPGPGNRIETCIDQPLTFCVDIVLNDSNARLYLSDNATVIAPSANFSYNNQLTDSVHVTFSWTPTAANAGLNNFVLTIADSTCRIPGITYLYGLSIPILVWDSVKTISDTFICPNSSIVLTTTGGSNYSWTILPGGTPNSLSNPNIASPVATPTTATTYAVVSNASNICPYNKDTVTITPLPASAITYPSVNITVSPDSNIAAGTTTTFMANVSGCTNPAYQWVINGSNIPGAVNNSYTSGILKNNDLVYCKVTCVDSCPSPKDTFSNAITMHVTNTTQNIFANSNTEISLYPNPNNGIFNLEVTGIPTGANDLNIDILNPLGQTVYNKKVTTSGSSYTDNIQLNELSSGIYMLRISDKSGTSIVRFTVAR